MNKCGEAREIYCVLIGVQYIATPRRGSNLALLKVIFLDVLSSVHDVQMRAVIDIYYLSSDL